MILSRTERLGTLWRHRGPGAAQMQDLSAQNPTPQALLPAGWVPYWNRAAVTGGGGGGPGAADGGAGLPEVSMCVRPCSCVQLKPELAYLCNGSLLSGDKEQTTDTRKHRANLESITLKDRHQRRCRLWFPFWETPAKANTQRLGGGPQLPGPRDGDRGARRGLGGRSFYTTAYISRVPLTGRLKLVTFLIGKLYTQLKLI